MHFSVFAAQIPSFTRRYGFCSWRDSLLVMDDVHAFSNSCTTWNWFNKQHLDAIKLQKFSSDLVYDHCKRIHCLNTFDSLTVIRLKGKWTSPRKHTGKNMKSITSKLYSWAFILEVEYILIFYKKCIFFTLSKVSGKSMVSQEAQDTVIQPKIW